MCTFITVKFKFVFNGFAWYAVDMNKLYSTLSENIQDSKACGRLHVFWVVLNRAGN